MADEMKPAYLIAGTDVAKIDSARRRLRGRAEAEGGAASFELFEAPEGKGTPDVEALALSIGSMSLMATRRYMLVNGIEKWGRKQQERAAGLLADLPSDTTVVLIANGKAPKPIADAVTAAGGQILSYEAPTRAQLPKMLVHGAAQRGFELSHGAAQFLVAHMGTSLMRLERELDRLALWAEGGEVREEDLEQMVADTSEVSNFELGDALVQGDRVGATRTAEHLIEQGASVPSIVYPAATTLRRAQRAVTQLEAGASPQQVERSLGLPPFLARKLLSAVRDADSEELREAMIAVADLEIWTRGGAEYPDDLALDLAIRRATRDPAPGRA